MLEQEEVKLWQRHRAKARGARDRRLHSLLPHPPAWSLTGHIQLEAEGQRGSDDAALRASFPGIGKGGEGAEQFQVEGTKKCPEHPF